MSQVEVFKKYTPEFLVPLWCIFFLVLAVFGVSWVCFFADSEMWPTVVSRDFFLQKESVSVGMKLVFHFFLYLNSIFASVLEFHPIFSARILFGFLATGSMYFVGKIVFQQTKSFHLALLAILFLGSSGIFIERAFRVRSDHLAGFFCLIALFYFLYKPLLSRKDSVLIGILFLLAFFSTPKAVLLIFSLIPFWGPHLVRFLESKRQIKISKKIIVPLGLLALLLAGFFGVFVDLYRAVLFFVNSFGEQETLIPYWSPIRFGHVLGFIFKDPHFVFGILLTLGSLALGSNSSQRNFKKLGIMSGILVLILALYPDRMPFLIASFLPFWTVAIFSNPLLIRSFLFLRKWRWSPILFSLIAVLLVSKAIVRGHFILRYHNNFEQKNAIESLNNYFKKFPDLKIYDSVGILFGLPTYTWYLGPGQAAANQWYFDQVKSSKVDIILRTQRLDWFGPELNTFLAADYIEVAAGVWARFARVDIRNLPRLAEREPLDQEFLSQLGPNRFGPDRPLYFWVLDGAGQEINSSTELVFRDSNRRLSLDQVPSVGLSYTDYLRVQSLQLPAVASTLIVSDFKFIDLGLLLPLNVLFRFDSEL